MPYPVNQEITAWIIRGLASKSVQISSFVFSQFAQKKERETGGREGGIIVRIQQQRQQQQHSNQQKLTFQPDLLFHLFQRYTMRMRLVSQGFV